MAHAYNDWDTVVAFPVVPFRHGAIDEAAFCRNVEYLIGHNWLDQGRRRVLGFGGGSLIHHLEADEQLGLIDAMCRLAANRAVVISGVIPNPPRQASRLLERQARLARPPDACLLLPINGTANPDGIYETLVRFCDDHGRCYGTRFFLYLRNHGHLDALARVTRECEWVVGVKVGTSAADVRPLVERIGDLGVVMWGIGDCSVDGIEQGARGQTSGIATLFVRAADEINNACRRGDLAAARRVEDEIRGFEALRFMEERAYNYSALVAAAQIAGFSDIDCGDGGPFNAAPPAPVLEKIRLEVERLRSYH